MTSVQIVGVIFGIMLVLMAVRVPIAISMFVAGAYGYIVQTGWLPFASFLNNQAFARFASYDLSVIPLFILMGHFATQGGISKALPLVIYAILTEQNIAKLFAAAMVPGIIAMLGYMAAIAIYVRLVPGHAPEVDDDFSRLTWQSFKGVAPIMAIFIIVFGGIYSGMFTPTEGAAVGAASTFVASLLKGEINWDKFKQCFYATADSSAMIFLIFIGADLMNGALALSQASVQLTEMVTGLGWPPLMIMAGILLFYVVLGAVMDELSMILLTIPIFFPIVMGMDFGLPKESVAIWFGILVLMVVEFGLLAPPVGLNVYVVNGMAKDIPIAESYRGVMPFLVSDTIRTLLILFFPGVCLWLVSVIT